MTVSYWMGKLVLEEVLKLGVETCFTNTPKCGHPDGHEWDLRENQEIVVDDHLTIRPEASIHCLHCPQVVA